MLGSVVSRFSKEISSSIAYEFPPRFISRSRTLNKKSRFSASSFSSFPLLSLSIFRFFFFFMSMFSKNLYSRISVFGGRYHRTVGITDKRELFNFEVSQLSSCKTFRPNDTLSKPFSRDRNFSYWLPWAACVTDERSYPDQTHKWFLPIRPEAELCVNQPTTVTTTTTTITSTAIASISIGINSMA